MLETDTVVDDRLTVRDQFGGTSLNMLLLSNLLTKFIQKGTLRVFDSGGRLHSFGDRAPGPTVTLRLHDRALEIKLAVNPELYAGEAYMDGTLTFEEGTDVGDLMGLFSLNRTGLFGHASQRLLRQVWRAARRWHQANPIGVAALACAAPLRYRYRYLSAVPGRRAQLLLRLL